MMNREPVVPFLLLFAEPLVEEVDVDLSDVSLKTLITKVENETTDDD
jgi:hypothetical protein